MDWHPAPPPRTPAHWTVWVLVGAFSFAFLTVLGGYVYFHPPPGANCNDPWVYCPIGPGSTPLGTALAVGNGSAGCPTGNGSSPSECTYSFAISDAAGGLSATDLAFALLGANSSTLDATYTVTLVTPESGTVGAWNSSTGSWFPATLGGHCVPANCLANPLEAGDSFLLRAVPNGGLAYSPQDDQLQIDAVGGGFSGWVVAPIN